MSTPGPTVLLFSYGTLQDKRVQLDTFGRELIGRPDTLPGYVLRKVPIHDPAMADFFAASHYDNAEPSPDPGDEISGIVFEVTEPELVAADRYEEDAGYRRIRVSLTSGAQAFVYLRP